ncbi:serine--tRNA ligase, mitochondrial [Colletes gigas]|uniref:serine--tRNA ligase, mitochondrial n=1 Tax=Colletes gigas TaxID=935657 RepID=UPI001C9ADE05|nr:serine--tRNA ligase, mitochondrial [Colletes gigas]XP_043260843.1 serine--tRNA ligase, mitochondrial [Colletes gigas]XP_043260844.1 serine--tRNA ligase, mitochondrial [Colletes gigas]
MWFNKGCNRFLKHQRFQTQILFKKRYTQSDVNTIQQIPEPEYNIEFLCNPSNRDIILNNIIKRKGIGNIDKVLEYSQKPKLKESFLYELSKIPNQTDPTILSYGNEPQVLKKCGCKPEFDFELQEFLPLVKKLKLLRNEALGPLVGQRGYIFVGDLAELEEALVHYTVNELVKHGFKLVSVPDIIPTKVIERCGLISDNERTLVYTLNSSYGDNYSLSGTSEMALAYKIMNTTFSIDDLPLKLAAVSRCFRAETSSTINERGIYRVHQFTKVEMFVCSEQEKSMEEFQNLQAIQENLFSSLNLHFKIIDMPPCDLGAPAYRKVDMEGWMPGRQLYGELSSCSNCTDYQSRRLSIKYKARNGEVLHVHTLNGTACAIPRMLIALCETHQTKHARIKIPEILIPYMRGKTLIRKQPVAAMRIYKYKQKL